MYKPPFVPNAKDFLKTFSLYKKGACNTRYFGNDWVKHIVAPTIFHQIRL